MLDPVADSIDLWGLSGEQKYVEMMEVEWKKYEIFSGEQGTGLQMKHAYDFVKKLRQRKE